MNSDILNLAFRTERNGSAHRQWFSACKRFCIDVDFKSNFFTWCLNWNSPTSCPFPRLVARLELWSKNDHSVLETISPHFPRFWLPFSRSASTPQRVTLFCAFCASGTLQPPMEVLPRPPGGGGGGEGEGGTQKYPFRAFSGNLPGETNVHKVHVPLFQRKCEHDSGPAYVC